MIAIKKQQTRTGSKFAVCDGVLPEYARMNPDGTFSGAAGIGVVHVSRWFTKLEEAQRAEEAYRAYAALYK